VSGRWAGWLDVPTLTANIFVAATNKPSIHKKSKSIQWDVFVIHKTELTELNLGLYSQQLSFFATKKWAQ